MGGLFSKKWTGEGEDLPLDSMQGRTVLVTGGNSGIGFEAAKVLAVRGGANVVICSRNLQRVNEAVEKIQRELKEEKASGEASTAGSIKGMQMDLASLDSVRSFAAAFLAQHDRLDVLIHNAGIMFFPQEENEQKKFKTVDGFERYTQINHLGSFLLTKLLWDLIVKTGSKLQAEKTQRGGDSCSGPDSARVVLVASGAQWEARAHGVDFCEEAWKATPESKGFAEKEYNPYGESKLMNVLFMRKLAQLIDGANQGSEAQGGGKKVNVLATAMHPGGTVTNLAEHAPALVRKMVGMTAMTAQQGCLGEVRCAVDPTVKNGSYYGPEYLMGGYPIDVSDSRLHNVWKWAKNQEQMDSLWEKSEKAVLAEEKFQIA